MDEDLKKNKLLIPLENQLKDMQTQNDKLSK